MSGNRSRTSLWPSIVLWSCIFQSCPGLLAQEPKSKTTPDDPAMEKVVASALLFAFGGASPDLKVGGYRGYTLGSTRKEVEAISPKVNNSDPVWEHGEDGTSRYFIDDKLIALGSTVRGDREIAIEKIKDAFGPVNKDAIEKFDSEIRLTYVGTRIIAVVNLEANQLRVTVYDREWLAARLRSDFEEKYRAMKWFAEGTKIALKGDFDSKAYPAFSQAGWFSFTPGLEAVAVADLVTKQAKYNKEAEREMLHPSAFGVFSRISTYIPENGLDGFVRCELRMHASPSRFVLKSNEPALDHRMACFDLNRDTALSVSHLANLGTRQMAERFFPPREDKVRVITPVKGNQKRYSWITKDFLKVEVTEFGIVRVIKEP